MPESQSRILLERDDIILLMGHPLSSQSTMEDYVAMPIEKFGEAVLKGMGWKKGEAIGRTNKG